MTNEQTFFLQILSDHLNGRQTKSQENIDWSVMMTYAQNHQVNGIVYVQCKDFLPDEVEKRLQRKYFSELYYYYNREALYKKIQQAFSEAQIPFFTVKGLAVAQFYPVPALRTMGDCDIVVHPVDKGKAHAVMMALGFDIPSKGSNEWVYFKDKMEFELHDHLLYNKPGNTKSIRRLTERKAWEKIAQSEDESCHELDWSFHFLFLLLHLRRHIIYYGVGFRQFMDLAVVIQHCEMDWNWLQETIKNLELYRFFHVCLMLLYHWFKVKSPVKAAELDDSFFEETTERIVANGVFGFDDETNHENGSINAFIWIQGPLWWKRVRTLFGNAFPNYQNMRYVSHYSFLDRRPWLLPLAWLFRFYRSIRYHMTTNANQKLNEAMIPRKKLVTREEMLARWGL